VFWDFEVVNGASMVYSLVFVMLWKPHLACLTLKNIVQMAVGEQAVLYALQENMESCPTCLFTVSVRLTPRVEIDLKSKPFADHGESELFDQCVASQHVEET
jgi:hypothetical protein